MCVPVRTKNRLTEKNIVIGKETQNLRLKKQRGFSLFELMIVMFIMVILISVALPTYQYTIQHARETVLKDNLFQMRKLIDQYTADKGKMPKSLEDLVTDKYLREKPIDPITNEANWNEILDTDPSDKDGGQGLKNVKSAAEGEDSAGASFGEY
jgi:general secretion pathway protein G